MIRNIVFDVGGVLVKLHYQPFVGYLASHGIDMSDLPSWLARVDLEAHERGEIGADELLARIAAMAERPIDPAELDARWLDMFERWDEMFDLASGLKREYRVFLLSNAGDRHWAHLDARYGLEGLVHGAMPSFRVGAVKPGAEIYRKAEQAFDLRPAETVFIDDLVPNVGGARARGWHAIHHRAADDTRSQLGALGVRLPGKSTSEG